MQTGHKVGDRGRGSVVVVPPLPTARAVALVGCAPSATRRGRLVVLLPEQLSRPARIVRTSAVQQHRRRRHGGRLLQHRDDRERREGGSHRRYGAAVEHGEGDIVGRAVLLLTILLQRLAAAVALFGAHAGGQQAAGSLRGTTHRQGIVLVAPKWA